MEKGEMLHGLILAGGLNSRMGRDKSQLEYHGIPHIQYLFDTMKKADIQPFISISKESNIDFTKDIILDHYPFKAPMNGLLSAHKVYPNHAWLVLPVDLPFVSKHTIERLVLARDQTQIATLYCSEDERVPEPLVGIWEATGLRRLKGYLEEENRFGLNSFLKHQEIKLIQPKDNMELYNANSQEDYQKAKSIIQ